MYKQGLYIVGTVVVACIADLVYMFWSRSQTGGSLNKAGWNAAGLGRGKYNIMTLARRKF
jgi:hypothetical protein